jgi:thiamine biosynthesis lipoprotein
MLKKALILLMILSVLSGCKKTETLTKYSDQTIEAGFDTIITLVGYTKSKADFDAYFTTVKTEFTRYNALFDRYKDYPGIANIKTINDNAGIAPVVVDQSIIDMLLLAKKWYEPSGKTFNVTMGAVFEIWHNYRTDGIIENGNGLPGKVPTLKELQAADKFSGWNNIQIDEAAHSVYITLAGASIDVGGIAKGYATELVSLKLEKDGLKSGIVNAGGNVKLIGSKPDGAKWAVGIQSPDMASSDSLDTLYATTSMAVVTSGDYQRYYYGPNNIIYHHIIDPATLFPARQCRAVTLLVSDSGLADTLAKPLFILPYKEALAFLEKFNADHPDEFLGAVWVYDLGKQPSGVTGTNVGNFTLVHSENIKQFSRLFAK